MSEQRPSRKSVFITGGSSGMGKAAVEILAERGSDIFIVDRDEAGHALAERINAARVSRAIFRRADVSDEAAISAAVEMCVAEFGGLDGAINCAGVSSAGKLLHELDLEEFDRCCAVNLRGVFICMKHQIPPMLKAGAGSIVVISSTAATAGLPRGSEYCASKAGVNGIVRAAALEYARAGLRFNTIMPGATWTPMAERALADMPGLDQYIETVPMNRFGTAHEVAALSVWLLSDDAAYLSGTAIPIDGARSII